MIDDVGRTRLYAFSIYIYIFILHRAMVRLQSSCKFIISHPVSDPLFVDHGNHRLAEEEQRQREALLHIKQSCVQKVVAQSFEAFLWILFLRYYMISFAHFKFQMLQSQSEQFKSRRTGTTGLVYVDLIRFLEATGH